MSLTAGQVIVLVIAVLLVLAAAGVVAPFSPLVFALLVALGLVVCKFVA